MPDTDTNSLCKICGKPISPERQRYHAKYCSSRCSRHANYEQNKTQNKQHEEEKAVLKTCKVCGGPFKSIGGTKCCSDACRNRVRSLNGLTSSYNKIKKCIVCGKEFQICQGYPFGVRRKCCSLECSDIRNKQTKEKSRQFIKNKKLYEATQENVS